MILTSCVLNIYYSFLWRQGWVHVVFCYMTAVICRWYLIVSKARVVNVMPQLRRPGPGPGLYDECSRHDIILDASLGIVLDGVS